MDAGSHPLDPCGGGSASSADLLAALRAEAGRRGPGSRPAAEVAAMDGEALRECIERRRRLAANLAERGLLLQVAPAYARRPVQGLVLADNLVAYTYEGVPAVLWPLLPGGPTARPPRRLGGPAGAAEGLLHGEPTGRFLMVAGERSLAWWEAARPDRPLRSLALPNDGFAMLALASDGQLGGAVLQTGALMVARAGSSASYLLNLTGWMPGLPKPLALGLLPGGHTALVLDAAQRMSTWRLQAHGAQLKALSPPLRLGLSPPASMGLRQGREPGQGILFVAPDGRHVVAGALLVDQEGHSDGTIDHPVLVALDEGGGLRGSPRSLRLHADEDESVVTFARQGNYLLTAGKTTTAGLAAPAWARRWTLPSAGEEAQPPLCFAASDQAIDLAALCADGSLAALALVGAGAAGAIHLWRLDVAGGPQHLWMFKPGHVGYLSVGFSGASDDTLALAPRPGGVLALSLAHHRQGLPAGEGNAVEPGRAYAGHDAYYLGPLLGDCLRVVSWS